GKRGPEPESSGPLLLSFDQPCFPTAEAKVALNHLLHIRGNDCFGGHRLLDGSSVLMSGTSGVRAEHLAGDLLANHAGDTLGHSVRNLARNALVASDGLLAAHWDTHTVAHGLGAALGNHLADLVFTRPAFGNHPADLVAA